MDINVNSNNGKELSNTSAHSGTTGLVSGGNKKTSKKHLIFIKGMYLINECIYKGQFHNTYKGINKITRQQVMIKMCNQFHDRITNETKMFRLLKDVSCIPRMLFAGEEKINGSTYFVRVTESFGPSIKILHAMMGHQFQLSTICIFTIQMLGVLEEIHKGNVVHRNLKPRKIVIHNDLKSLRLFVLDLKYSRKYKHKNGQLVRYNENSRILNKIFCNKFSSIGSHLGISPSRKDDMESLGYMLLYFFRKGNMFGNKRFKQREEKLKFYEEWKLSLIPELLTNEMPIEFVSYLNYVKAMNIHDAPEYEVWRKAFKQLLFRSGVSPSEYTYEWIPLIKTGLKQSVINNSVMNELAETPSVAAKSVKEVLEVEDKIFITTNGSQVNNSSVNGLDEASKKNQEEKEENVFQTTAGATEEDHKKRIDTYESATGQYGPVEIDLSEINNSNNIRQPSNYSSMTFGGQQQNNGIVNGNKQNGNSNNNNNNNNGNQIIHNVNKPSSFLKTEASFNTDRGSDSPGFIKKQSLGNSNTNNGYGEVIYNHSQLTQEESSHLLGKNQNSLANSPRDDVNLSNYSTDDLSIIDDESQNSLASLLLRQPEVLQIQPLVFRHKQPA